MGRKRHVPLPPPPPRPPPPQEESSSEEDSSAEEEEEAEATPATQKSPKPPSTTATADDADSSDGSDEESSDSGKIDAEAFELRQIAASSGKPAAAAASEVESEGHEPTPPGKAKKKGKAGAEKAAPEPSPSGKAKKAKSGAPEKAASEVSPSREGKKKHKAQPEKTAPSGKPGQLRRWTIVDEIKVLEALVRHVKANGTQPGAGELIAAVGGSLQRKNCRNIEMYEKVRNFRLRYEKAVSTGNLPVKGDDLLKFKLSEQVWGENAKQVAAASMAQNDAGSPKSKKKGRTSKEKTDVYSNGGTTKEATTSADENVGTPTERNKGKATEEKVDEDTKGRSSKNAKTVDTPAKSKKWGNHKEELEGEAKAGTTNTKETVHTPSANGGTSVRSKCGKSDRGREDEDAESPKPKEASTATQNDRSLALLKEGEIHEEKVDTDANTNANVKGMRKGFDELQNLYPNLTSYAESIQAHHPCGETLKRAFEFIHDEKAHALESKIKKQRVAELRMETRRADTKKEVTNTFIGLLD